MARPRKPKGTRSSVGGECAVALFPLTGVVFSSHRRERLQGTYVPYSSSQWLY